MKVCPSCKKAIEAPGDTCEYCGLVFSKWEAKNRPYDEKEVDKEIELARSEYRVEEDKKSFRVIGIAFLAVIATVVVWLFVRPVFIGPEKKAAVDFLAAVKSLDVERVQNTVNSSGVTNVEKYGGLTPESLALIVSYFPREYQIKNLEYEGNRSYVKIIGTGRWADSTGKIFVSKEEGSMKVEDFECELIEDGLLVLPPYNQNQTLSQMIMEKSVEQLKFTPLGEEYYKDTRVKESRKIKMFYRKGRHLRPLKVFPENEESRVTFSGDGRYFLAASYDNYFFKIWRTSDWSLVKEYKTEYRVDSVAALPDGSAFLMGDIYEHVTLVSLKPEGVGPISMFSIEQGGSPRLAAAGNSRLFGTGSSRKILTLWSYPEQENLVKVNIPFEITCIAFSPAAPYLAAATDKNTFLIWDLRNGVGGYFSIQKVDPSAITTAIAFSPNGRYLLTCHKDGSIAITDLLLFKEKCNFFVKNTSTTDGAFSFDGKVFATAHENSNIYLWDTGSGNKLDILKGHDGSVRSVAFSPVGDYIASAGADKKVIVWGY